ncbi:MAG: hypothetical protein GY701_24115 [Sulfitobacter sp.]|nr:hypothetical protein [Sulfitobacter sp.]
MPSVVVESDSFEAGRITGLEFGLSMVWPAVEVVADEVVDRTNEVFLVVRG